MCETNKICAICNESMMSGDAGFVTNDGVAVHCSCLEEHCVSTNCLMCKIGEYPFCVFQSLKKALMSANGGNENDSSEQ